MKRFTILSIVAICLLFISASAVAETIDVLIKGVDDSVKTNKQQDYKEAVMNAKLQAIERAGVEIQSITRVVNFELKYDMVESKAKALLLPGFQIMDLGYQQDGTYQVVLSGKIQLGKKTYSTREEYFNQLIEKSFSALKVGKTTTAEKLAHEAMEVPGFKNNKDALFLLKSIEKRRASRKLEATFTKDINVRFKLNNRPIKFFVTVDGSEIPFKLSTRTIYQCRIPALYIEIEGKRMWLGSNFRTYGRFDIKADYSVTRHKEKVTQQTSPGKYALEEVQCPDGIIVKKIIAIRNDLSYPEP